MTTDFPSAILIFSTESEQVQPAFPQRTLMILKGEEPWISTPSFLLSQSCTWVRNFTRQANTGEAHYL